LPQGLRKPSLSPALLKPNGSKKNKDAVTPTFFAGVKGGGGGGVSVSALAASSFRSSQLLDSHICSFPYHTVATVIARASTDMHTMP